MLFFDFRPTVTFPSAVYLRTEGLGLSPSSNARVGPPSHTPITEFVVPKSIPNPTCFCRFIWNTSRPSLPAQDLLNAAQASQCNRKVWIFPIHGEEGFHDFLAHPFAEGSTLFRKFLLGDAPPMTIE